MREREPARAVAEVAVGLLGGMRGWAAFLLPLLIGWLLDQVNCANKLQLSWSGRPALELQRIELSVPDCSMDGLATVTGVATGFANLAEVVRGYEPIIRAARADAAQHVHGGAGQSARDLELTLLAFDHDGYKATFRVGTLKAPEVRTVATERSCLASRVRRARHDEALACDAELGLRLERLLAPYGARLLEYTYTRDFVAQQLTLDVEHCLDEEDEELPW